VMSFVIRFALNSFLFIETAGCKLQLTKQCMVLSITTKNAVTFVVHFVI
jgi:hypothetical protein